MDNKSSITSLMSLFVRAFHAQNTDNPVFYDNIARKLLTDEEFESIKKYIVNGIDFFAPQKKGSFKDEGECLEYIVNEFLAPTPLARSNFCENSLHTAIQTGCTQYVILGAGMDTFCFREEKLLEKIKVFEVDHPLTQEDKKKRISNSGLVIPKNLKFVPMDFKTGDLRGKLMSAGFDKSKKTFYSLLGVSYYLNSNDFEKLVNEISSFSADGSTFLFDIADEELKTSNIQRIEKMMQMAKAAGESMLFCLDGFSLQMMLEKYNFLIYELLEPNDIQIKYFNDRCDNLCAFEHIYYVLSVLKNPMNGNTRDNILSCAVKLFASYGYDGVSVRDISSRLGITQAALYKHYNSKQDIFDCIISKMENEDRKRANEYGVPEDILENCKNEYENTDFSNLCKYALAQFRYWTEDEFASAFRKMITIEQYKSGTNASMYQNYFSKGVIDYTSDLLHTIFKENKNPYILALDFFAPIYMLINMYDSAEDKLFIKNKVKEHIEIFYNKFKNVD